MTKAKSKDTKIPPEIAEKEFAELTNLELKLAEMGVNFQKLVKGSFLTLAQIAMKVGNFSESTISKNLKFPYTKTTVERLVKIAWACGYDVEITFKKRN